MQKKIQTLIWLVAVIVLSSALLAGLERWEARRTVNDQEPTRTALVMLVGYAGEEFPGSENADSYKKVGCEDALVTYEIPVVSKRLASVLSALATFEPQKVYIIL